MFRKVLIANRGEVAVRVIRTLRERQIASVAVFSDEAERVGPSPSGESYLRVDRILDAARKHERGGHSPRAAARDGHVDVFTGEGVGEGLADLTESYNRIAHNGSPIHVDIDSPAFKGAGLPVPLCGDGGPRQC
jgi:hypothetical protein